MQEWIETYGYWAVFLGGIFEGETILIVAGFAISRGYLQVVPTFLLAAAGGSLGDFAYYSLGRAHGQAVIRRFPRFRRLRARAALFLRRWGRAAAFLTRFAYGLRVILPMSMGAARLRVPIFVLFNTLGSITFVTVYLTLGFLFGETIQDLLGRVRPYERWIISGLLLLGALIWAVREWRLYRSNTDDEAE